MADVKITLNTGGKTFEITGSVTGSGGAGARLYFAEAQAIGPTARNHVQFVSSNSSKIFDNLSEAGAADVAKRELEAGRYLIIPE